MTVNLDDEALARVDDGLLARVMRPYHSKDTIYLADAAVGAVDGRLVAFGDFAIAESCYIDDTGHFNAVEAGICYNQITYLALAVAVRDSLMTQFGLWTLDDYWQRQLPDVLIYRQSMQYRSPIDSANFTGRFEVVDVVDQSADRGILKLSTTISFEDGKGGFAHGAVDLALVNVPAAARR